MEKRAFLATSLAAVPALWLASCSTAGVKLDAPYVSTPYAAVDEMLRLARVGPTDMVYDLGCGDGRFVIAAAEKFGARGVGIDLDPQRLVEAAAGARRAGVTGRVSFRQEDLFTTDFSSATVVTLFLFAELNARLAPRLRASLKPGSRIVAYEFGIPGWDPDEVVQLHLDSGSHRLMLWRIG
ncbi:MAG: methyltransferase domain-containing protein [Betaproteobacteria bacterium]|nr:methyltransferase domain-containing protein [Betaproteobacteria bacterium]